MYIEGRLRTRKWEDTTGATRFTTEIVVDNFIFLDARPAGSEDDMMHDDIPVDEDLPF